MHVTARQECRFGGEKDSRSHCARESVYSYLTRCIQLKALEYYLGRESVGQRKDMAV